MKNRWLESKGFTLIELMLVAAIIGLLAAIAVPKFANMIVKAKEARVRGSLGAMRGATAIMIADLEMNVWDLKLYVASDPTGNLAPKYIDKIPWISIPTVPQHRESPEIDPGFGPPTDWWGDNAWFLDNSGVWHVQCTHPDSSGRVWTTW